MRKLVCVFVSGAMLAGCATPSWLAYHPLPHAHPADDATPTSPPAPTNAPAEPPKFIVTPVTTPTGKVVHVNETARFAVLNFPVGMMPGMESRLNVYRHGLKVGEVKVTGPQQDDNTVADILTGEVQVGDELRTN